MHWLNFTEHIKIEEVHAHMLERIWMLGKEEKKEILLFDENNFCTSIVRFFSAFDSSDTSLI